MKLYILFGILIKVEESSVIKFWNYVETAISRIRSTGPITLNVFTRIWLHGDTIGKDIRTIIRICDEFR